MFAFAKGRTTKNSQGGRYETDVSNPVYRCIVASTGLRSRKTKNLWELKYSEKGTEQWAYPTKPELTVTLFPKGEAASVLFIHPDYVSLPDLKAKIVAIGVVVLPKQTVVIATMREGMLEWSVVLDEIEIPKEAEEVLKIFKSTHSSAKYIEKVSGRVKTETDTIKSL